MTKLILLTVLAFGLLNSRPHAAQSAPLVRLSGGGKALLDIHISSQAAAETKQQARLLAEYLRKMSGAEFSLRSDSAAQGISVGVGEEWPQFAGLFEPKNESKREAYLIRSHPKGVYILGASQRGLSHAVWEFLRELGCRQFFPGKNWEVIPSNPDLRIAIDRFRKPDFLYREMFIGLGPWPDAADLWERWKTVNGLDSDFTLNTSHSWNTIVKKNEREFEAHPEYFALVNGRRNVKGRDRKFCISNPGLRDLVANYAVHFFDENPEQNSVSLEPTDFSGWCQCEACAAIGTPSDRMVLLVNQAIAKVRQKYPAKYVAFYAYWDHSAPPTLPLSPGIIVSVTTALSNSNVSFGATIDGWRDKGATIGVRDYASVPMWEGFGAPYNSKAGRVDEYVRSLASYSKLGEKLYRTEMGDDFGPNGLGYYIGARLLMDSSEATEVPALINDFLEKCFGDAVEPMRKFYEAVNGIDGKVAPTFDTYAVQQLYGYLDKGLKMTKRADVKARLSDLVLYVHHLELYDQFLNSSPGDRPGIHEALVRHAYRSRKFYLIPSRVVYQSSFENKLGPTVTHPVGVALSAPEDKDPWKSSTPFSDTEIQSLVENGLKPKFRAIPREVRLVSDSKDSEPASFIRVRGSARMLLVPVRDGRVTITSRIDFDRLFGYARNYSVRNSKSQLVMSGLLADNEPVHFEGKAGQTYELFVFASYRTGYGLKIEGAAAAVQTNLDDGHLHLFTLPTTFRLYVPGGLPTWELTLKTSAPGETARVVVRSPDGRETAVLETTTQKEQTTSLKGQEGFWTVQVQKAQTGMFYSALLKVDAALSPWASLDGHYLLQVGR